MKKIIYILSATILLLSGCKKTEFAGNDVTGEGLVDFTLVSPASGTKVVLNSATPNAGVIFSWNAAKPGLTLAPTYKIVAALKTGGDLNNPLISFDAASTTSFTVTQKQLDDALKAKGIADGATTDLIWSVSATNGSVSILSTSVFNISITRFKDGASPFLLLGPTSTTTAQSINPNSTSDFYTFNWTKSAPATGGPAVKYKVLFAERKLDANGNELPINWSAPLFSINSNNAGVDTFAKVTYKAISDSMFNKGFTNLPSPVALKWTVVASSGTWSQLSDYANSIVIIREIKIYIVGSATPNGWDASQAIRMIPDASNFGSFYMYVYLVGGQEMKFLNGQAFPPASGAVDWGQNPAGAPGDLTADNENNIPITTSGVYRVTFDLTNLKYYLQTGRMATVGGATPADWNPPGVFPTQALSFIGTDKFLGIETFLGGNEFKLIDNNAWPSGGPITQSRDYGKGSSDGIMLESGENNIPGPAAGRNRVIWDGSDPLNLKYDVSPALEMRVVGDGINQAGVNDWDPPTSPQMTYAGNGKWIISLTLKAGKQIKFLAGNAWGAFDYEDNGDNGTVGSNIKRKIKYDGGDNFSTPATAGLYVIILDEHAQTVNIFP